MKIDEQRRLVVPVVTDTITKKVKGKDVTENVVRVHAYHVPISREVFEANFRVLAATKAALASKGSHYLMGAGPRVSALTLKDEGLKDAAGRGSFDDEGKVIDEETPALLAEIKRLTTVLCAGPNGWDMLPVDVAIQQGKIDEEDWEEATSSLVFFTCNYSLAKKADRAKAAEAMASFLGGSTTSSPPMEFLASLPSSTPAEHTKKTHSSIPS
ncbi:TPA: hypothetical protein ACKE3D_002115 [Burkholderia dolosa]